MLNIYNYVEDLNCTEYYKQENELKELIDDTVSDFLTSKNIDYEYLSDSHIMFSNEEIEEELEEELENILDEVYTNFIEELEELEELEE